MPAPPATLAARVVQITAYVLHAQVTSSIGALKSGPEVSHRIIHIFTGKNNFKLSHLDFASKWVGKNFVVRSLRSNIDTLTKMVAGTLGHVRGHLHEQLMHLLLPQVGA